jgi:N6-adenosine-specific RNA methylase IME4
VTAGPLVTPEREGRFGLIYVDPPTRVESYSAKGQRKAPPYPTMSRCDLLGLKVGKLAAPNCALVIWSTSTHLGQMMECIRVWGFEYKSYGGWGKRTKAWTPECESPKWAFGTGRWQRSTLEIYLMAARGAPLICSHTERNFVEAALREHSRKPDEVREALERMFPRVPKIELFARQRREGWDCWGDEVEMFGGDDA